MACVNLAFCESETFAVTNNRRFMAIIDDSKPNSVAVAEGIESEEPVLHINSAAEQESEILAKVKDWLIASFQAAKSNGGVLVVDDDDFNIKILKRFVAHDGYRTIYQASNGEEAVQIYKQHEGNVKVILMDNDMPVLNGMEATKQILAWNQNEGRRCVKVIGVTGNVHEDKLQGCLAAGMTTVLKKPVSMEELSRVMLEALLTSPSDEAD
jgi:CheY-like chemotaxis protein